MDDPVVLRMIERIIGVLIAGMAIFLGYRLFFHLPFQNDGKGKIELPGVKVVLSRVGPGVFFAAFGSIILYYSLTSTVSVSAPGTIEQASTPGGDVFHGFTGMGTRPENITPQQRGKALNSIWMLNCAQRLVGTDAAAAELSDQLTLAITDAKRSLMLSVWNEQEWGPVWQLGNAGPADDAPLELRSVFNSIHGSCPDDK
ncbi:hypothetical protein [Pseudomaricurvus sp. HS19]|uniref:hypothetical protein n=1 Tax=Pseudomaricurvus sp. HS19 TaxID=2692626 RepID=UPI0013690801|nr:hypothetical protein [Pseudomaricurvus sp. HS19]MYM64000.1 hypothetical protein [Pseudomaricurvus sp. HS19]